MIHITKDNFDSEVANSTIPVVVDFWASWCGPCRMLAPILEELDGATEYKIAKINVDEEMELSMKFQIASIPTILLFVGGKVVAKSVGLVSKKDLEEFIKKNI